MSPSPPKTLGVRHVALNVRDPQLSKKFYTEILGMTVEWEPDPDNVYLTSAQQDNLALHRAKDATSGPQTLDHIGIFLKTKNDVQTWYDHLKKNGVRIVNEIKTHRDGATTFYAADPDGITIQFLFHPPVSVKSPDSFF